MQDLAAVRHHVATQLRAAFYARYSSDNQRAASIEDQLRNCNQRAAPEGWLVLPPFVDAALTAAAHETRAGYQAMLAAAYRGEFDILVVDDLSRLARDQVEQEMVIRKLEFRGIRIIALDGYDSQTKLATRKIQRTIKGMVNEIRLDELREQVHRGLTGQALKQYWCGGRVYGYSLKPILDPAQRDPYGQPTRIGTVLEIDPQQAEVVLYIFSRFAEGASALTIAKELNARGIPSPGSTWKRTVRRCHGWVNTAVREILRNELYRGVVRWNVGTYERDPESRKRVWRARPKSEWIQHTDELLRIASDELFEKAQKRRRAISSDDSRLKSGGKSKHLLSGLLRCGVCDASYVVHDKRTYGCNGYAGGACSNQIRVRRDALESVILKPVYEDLLAPDRVEKMAHELQRAYVQALRSLSARAEAAPAEIAALDTRIARLRERQRTGELELTNDELQTVIDRLLDQHRKLEQQPKGGSESGNVIILLPATANVYRKQIAKGLDGDPVEAAKARLLLRELIGPIRLNPGPDRALWASYTLQPSVLVKAAVGGTRYAG